MVDSVSYLKPLVLKHREAQASNIDGERRGGGIFRRLLGGLMRRETTQTR
jgi:hypothetical protein